MEVFSSKKTIHNMALFHIESHVISGDAFPTGYFSLNDNDEY